MNLPEIFLSLVKINELEVQNPVAKMVCWLFANHHHFQKREKYKPFENVAQYLFHHPLHYISNSKNQNSMKQIYLLRWAVLPLLLLFTACDQNGAGPVPKEADGWAPVYSTNTEALTISSADPKTIEKGGKIYTKGTLLYQVETGKGIHVINIADPANPQKVKFININGAQEMAIKGQTLYANNLNDLVVVDITDYASVKEVGRLKNVFHLVNQYRPPGEGYFECIDASKGTVVGWEQKKLQSPRCKTN